MRDIITIRRATNGLIIDHEGPNDEFNREQTVIVEPQDATCPEEAQAGIAVELCYWLIDYYGWRGSKHDSHRVRVTVDIKEE